MIADRKKASFEHEGAETRRTAEVRRSEKPEKDWNTAEGTPPQEAKIGLTRGPRAVLHEQYKVLLRPDGHEDPSLLPFHVQICAVVGVLVQGDGELLNRHHDLLFLHVHARQVLLLMVFSAPLPGLLVDDELPCAFRRERVQGVSSGRHFGAADIERDGRGERGGFIGAGTPDFSVRRKICPQLSALERRTAVLNGDFLAVDGAVGGARRAGTLALVFWLLLLLRRSGEHRLRESGSEHWLRQNKRREHEDGERWCGKMFDGHDDVLSRKDFIIAQPGRRWPAAGGARLLLSRRAANVFQRRTARRSRLLAFDRGAGGV